MKLYERVSDHQDKIRKMRTVQQVPKVQRMNE